MTTSSQHDATATTLHLERGLFVLTCQCGWRCEPTRAAGLGAAWDRHIAAINGFWSAELPWREESVLTTA